MTMENNQNPNPNDLIAALTPTRLYWRTMSQRFDQLDEKVRAVVMTPLFQHTYGAVHGGSIDDMILDVRSATSLMVSKILSTEELEVFLEMELTGHLNQGLALAARHLRPRVPTIPTSSFVQFTRNVVFTYILKLVGEDLKTPRPVLQSLLDKMELTDVQRMSLLQTSLVNCSIQSDKIVLH